LLVKASTYTYTDFVSLNRMHNKIMSWITKLKDAFRPKRPKYSHIQTFGEIGQKTKPWWGTFTVEEGQSRFWRVGSVIIFVDRFTNEWHIASAPVEKSSDDLNEEAELDLEKHKFNFKTFTFKTQAELSINPILADRPLASKLEQTLYIPGGEEILLYVSSPVWVRVATSNSKVTLAEVPTVMLSDTWFGKTTTSEGILCYAAQTYCSSHLKDIPSGPDRIVSPMFIKNETRSILQLEKVSVPLPYLSVYADSQNFLWTEQLNVHRTGEEQHPHVHVEKGPPRAIEDIHRLTQARKDLHAASGLKKLLLPW